jgi:predicted Zn-dependent peptidase
MACQIAQPSERMGDQINAYMSEEFPYYEGRVLRQNLDDALALNLDMLLFSKFTPARGNGAQRHKGGNRHV